MSILDDDIMTLDNATGRFAVAYRKHNLMRDIVWIPPKPGIPSSAAIMVSLDEVADAIKAQLDELPIMEVSDERIADICRPFIRQKYRGKFVMLGPGNKMQTNTEHDHHWEFLCQRTRYTVPCGFLIYPLY